MTRPVKPYRDPLLEQLLVEMKKDPRSRNAKANVSGLSPACLKRWDDGTTRRPQAVSLQMAWRMLGYELQPVRIRR